MIPIGSRIMKSLIGKFLENLCDFVDFQIAESSFTY